MPLRILLLSHKFLPDIGGIETISEFLANAFSEAGYDVRVVTWSEGINEKKLPFGIIRRPSIINLLTQHKWADIVFENNPCLRLSWPGVFFKKPFIIALHTWISRTNGKLDWQDKFKLIWLKRAFKVIACSDAVRRRCWSNALVIGNPYNKQRFRVLENVPRDSDFIFLGRLVSDKGVSVAIQAFHRFISLKNVSYEPASQYTLTIIGDGPERNNLQNLVYKLKLEDYVTFTGALQGEALVEQLNRHKFLLVPSVWEEPFGLVAIEGMACGCLPIVSNGGGLPDAIGNAGLLFERGNIDSLTDCIINITNNDTLKKLLYNRAQAHLQLHTPEVIAKQYLKVIEMASALRK